MRDNIYVLNAIINSITSGNAEACDITVYDVEKCFDTLWAQECINTLYEHGLDNDKLVLLFEETRNAKIAVKTTMGMTERISIKNLIMQGTVFGSIICSTVMDKLAKIFYQDKNLLYMYKSVVEVPVLGMVDDVLNVAKCSEQAILSNSTINTFMEQNKLKLAAGKCSQVHIGKKVDQCSVLKVHEESMKESDSEKYLGDFIRTDGKIDSTINDRIRRAYSYLSEIRALLSDMPFGKRRLQIGLLLRDAMFVNGVLFNSEAWSAICMKHIEELELIDRSVLKFIIGAHAKTASEVVYLETATIPLRHIISIRRMLYFQTIVQRSEEELIKRIYNAQKENPNKGDWIHYLKEDFKYIKEDINETEAKEKTKYEYKKLIKKKVREQVFLGLKLVKESHSKVREIQYSKFQIQEYMMTPQLTNQEVANLFSLRTRTYRNVSNNFGQNNNCSLGCSEIDSQEHWILCSKTVSNKQTQVQYSDLYGNLEKQVSIVKLFSKLEEEREELTQREAASTPVAEITGP